MQLSERDYHIVNQLIVNLYSIPIDKKILALENFLNIAAEDEVWDACGYLYTQIKLYANELRDSTDISLLQRLKAAMMRLSVCAPGNNTDACEPKFYLSIAAIAKDEGAYLAEWIEYHRIVGVEKFYIYDNDSTDNTDLVLAPYIKEGIVKKISFPGIRRQLYAYIDAVCRSLYSTKWLAVIDLDEFLVPLKAATVPDFLRGFPSDITQLLVDWRAYNSNGHIKKPEGLVIENYKTRTKGSNHSKCIIKPKPLCEFGTTIQNPHQFNAYCGRTVNENCEDIIYMRSYLFGEERVAEKIALNHYFMKSKEEYITRRSRLKADVGTPYLEQYATVEEMYEKTNEQLVCDVYDDSMDKYVPLIKKALSEKGFL